MESRNSDHLSCSQCTNDPVYCWYLVEGAESRPFAGIMREFLKISSGNFIGDFLSSERKYWMYVVTDAGLLS